MPNRATASRGFTLVEMLVAFGVFTLFFGGLFALYRVGSNAFSTGSWKLARQKQAQMFLEVLKERLEQASNLAILGGAANTDQMQITAASVFFPGNANTAVPLDVKAYTTSRNILLFSVCKPNLGPNTGLWCGHALKIIPGPGGGKPGHLRIFSSSQAGAFSTGIAAFPPTPPGGGAAWLTDPTSYQLGPNGYSMNLDDVGTVSLLYQTSDAPGSASGTKVININVTLFNPKHTATTLQQSIRARVPAGVAVVTAALASMGT